MRRNEAANRPFSALFRPIWSKRVDQKPHGTSSFGSHPDQPQPLQMQEFAPKRTGAHRRNQARARTQAYMNG